MMFFMLILLLFSLFFMDILYMWVLLEVIFFLVVCLMVMYNKNKNNLSSIIYYLFVQALSGLILLFSLLSEYCLFGNLYLLNSAIGVFNFCFLLLGLLIKLGFYPFYLQIIMIMSFFEYKQCFFFLIFPKMIPILMMFDLLQQEIMLISYMVLVFFVFMVSSSQSVLSIDFREILGWSSMGQMSWMILSLFNNIFLAIVYFFLYAILLMFLIKYINQFNVKFFLSFSSYSMSSVKEIIIFFMLMFMSSVAPFLLFYMKMLIISSFFFNMFFFSMLLILFLSISILFFYLRMMQFLIGVGYYSSFYSSETKHLFISDLYILFLFTFGGIFLLLI